MIHAKVSYLDPEDPRGSQNQIPKVVYKEVEPKTQTSE